MSDALTRAQVTIIGRLGLDRPRDFLLWYGAMGLHLLGEIDTYWAAFGRIPVTFVIPRMVPRYQVATLNLASDRLLSDGLLRGGRTGKKLRVTGLDLTQLRRHPAASPRVGDVIRRSNGARDERLMVVRVSALEVWARAINAETCPLYYPTAHAQVVHLTDTQWLEWARGGELVDAPEVGT